MQIAIGLYPGLTVLDAIGPYQVLTQAGDEVVVCAERTGRLTDDNGLLTFDIEHTFADVPRPDLLLVPGGFITRKLARDRDPIVDWIAAAIAWMRDRGFEALEAQKGHEAKRVVHVNAITPTTL